VLLGEIDGKFVDDFTSVSGEDTKECAVTVHDDESETRVGFQEFGEGFGVEFVVAEVERPVEGIGVGSGIGDGGTYVLIGL
jgi:hypothetical protein